MSSAASSAATKDDTLLGELGQLFVDIKEDVALDETITSMYIDGQIYALPQSAKTSSDGFLRYKSGDNKVSINYSSSGLFGEVSIDNREFTITPRGVVESPMADVDSSLLEAAYDPALTVDSVIDENDDTSPDAFPLDDCCNADAMDVLSDTSFSDKDKGTQAFSFNWSKLTENKVSGPLTYTLVLLSVVILLYVRQKRKKAKQLK
jgi:hypothetical protein